MDCNRPQCVDLHIHSLASDGSLSAEQIIKEAETLSLGAISITDHDTLDGSRKAVTLCRFSPVRLLTGVEISANPPEAFNMLGSLHILGYHIDLDNMELNNALTRLQESRNQRIPRIIERLNLLGMALSEPEIKAEVGASIAGRPHIAAAMIKKGFVDSIDEAFIRFLGRGMPAYVDKYRIPVDTVIEAVRNAGGIPILAHPYLIQKPPDIIEKLILGLKSIGLLGIEVYYPGHSTDAMKDLIGLANRNDLLITGGTDFHGNINPNIKMGSGTGDLCVPFELYDKLIMAAELK